MTFLMQMKVAQQLVIESLRVTWKEKWLLSYSALWLGICTFLFGIAALVARFASTVGSWYLWLTPEMHVPFSVSAATIQILFVALVTFVNVVIVAVVTHQLVNYFNRTPLSFPASFRLQAIVWRQVLCWASIAAAGTLLTSVRLHVVTNSLALGVVRVVIAECVFLIGMFVIPALVKDQFSVWAAVVRSVRLIAHFIVLVLWAVVLWFLFLFIALFVIFASAMVVAKLLGLIFAWSPFVALIPFALIVGGLVIAVILYFIIAWAIFALRTYSYLTTGILSPF